MGLRFAWFFAIALFQVECLSIMKFPPLHQVHATKQTALAAMPNPNNIDNNDEVVNMDQNDDHNDHDNHNDEQVKDNQIKVSSEMDMDIPIEVAYDAFSDLSRQPSWSPWLRSVEYTDQVQKKETIWKMRYFGLPITWHAVSTNLERPYLIQWKSIKGLRNFGRVEFEPLASDRTRMKMTLTFETPRLAASLLGGGGNGKGGTMTKLVETKMLQTTLQNFRDIVVADDLPRHYYHQQQRAAYQSQQM